MIQAYQSPLVGKTVGVVFGTFAPLHQGHLDLIMRAKKENDAGCLILVDGRDDDRGEELLNLKRRYRYIREFFADDDLVAVHAIDESELGIEPYPQGWGKFMQETLRILRTVTEAEPVFYVGEQGYYDYLVEHGYKCIKLNRTDHIISATLIRQNPIKHWDQIATPFRRLYSYNILICGTASEGKTIMTTDIGKYFNAPYSYEWARKYMKESCIAEWELDGGDYLALLQGQYTLNKEMINSPGNHGIFIADSDSMVTRTYAEYYSKDPTCAITPEQFEKVAILADEITAKCKWDKIFILAPHGVFVDDHERYMAHSGIDERQQMFDILCRNIKNSGNWDKVTILNGSYYENFLSISNHIKEVIRKGLEQ